MLCLLLVLLLTVPSHVVSFVFACHAMQQLSRFTKRERENVCFCFYFLVVIVFLHKMNKVNIFYYTEQKKGIFRHPTENKRRQL